MCSLGSPKIRIFPYRIEFSISELAFLFISAPFPSFIFFFSFRFSPLFALVRFCIAFWKRFKESKTGSLTFLYHCGAILYKLCCKIHGHFRMREIFSFDHKLFQANLFIHIKVAVNDVKFGEWRSHLFLSVYGKQSILFMNVVKFGEWQSHLFLCVQKRVNSTSCKIVILRVALKLKFWKILDALGRKLKMLFNLTQF